MKTKTHLGVNIAADDQTITLKVKDTRANEESKMVFQRGSEDLEEDIKDWLMEQIGWHINAIAEEYDISGGVK